MIANMELFNSSKLKDTSHRPQNNAETTETGIENDQWHEKEKKKDDRDPETDAETKKNRQVIDARKGKHFFQIAIRNSNFLSPPTVAKRSQNTMIATAHVPALKKNTASTKTNRKVTDVTKFS